MPLVFGQIASLERRDTAACAPASPPPRPEHPDEQCVRVTLPGVDMGVLLPPSVPPAEGLFYDDSPDRPLVCVCDAEISNPQEIADHLAARGVQLKSTTTAELIGKLVVNAGEKAFSLLQGSFSCVVWTRNSLWLAVDRFGMKRLSYGAGKEGVSFSSRVDWVSHQFPEVSLAAVYQYLNLGFVPSPETIHRDVRKLQPGSYLHWDGTGARVGRYWQMNYPEDLPAQADKLARGLREHLRQAVRVTLRGLERAPTGCYLSGGTDSSTVLGMTCEVRGRGIPAFSVGFTEESFSELRYSRIAARHFGATAHECSVRPEDGWRCLPSLVRAFDEPFGNSSAVGAYACVEMASGQNVQVMLAGDGGDELFGGNERYRKDKIYAWLGSLPRKTIQNPLWDALFAHTRGSPLSARLKRIFYRASLKNPERFYLEDCLTSDLEGNFFAPELAAEAAERRPLQIMEQYYSEAPARSELNRLLYVDLRLTIAENDLVKVRQTAAACGVRVRFPMLDHTLAEFSGRVPADLKVRGLQKRYLFKLALRDFLPKEVLAKKKQGFGVPVSLWFRRHPQFRELLLDVCSDRSTGQRGYFRSGHLQRIVDEHMRGFQDWGQLLWAVLMLELWHREAGRAR
jgi:asparagine synthase (glutamine-hydrolysing)